MADPIAILIEIISSKFVETTNVKKIPIKKPTKTMYFANFFPYALLAKSVIKKSYRVTESSIGQDIF